ncbi:MAG TPA: hypothetical protein VFE13_16620 [Caulobacteraceae bacterium]|jgi:hypothetical protein|nr:hypothetical protein [Caulobacteraceae bacterium]
MPLDLPSARQSPPWSWCGDPRESDFGFVFARRGANGAVMLSFDRAGRSHALTLFAEAALSRSIVIYGRRFDVVAVGATS